MTAAEAIEAIDACIFCGAERTSFEVRCACGADLMSDVMAFVKESVVLLTGLVNPQTIRTAELMDIKLVVFVRGKKPGADLMAMADEAGIVLAGTKLSMYIACGRLYQAGLHDGGTRRI